jgi:fatty-acyl-CoA synthase
VIYHQQMQTLADLTGWYAAHTPQAVALKVAEKQSSYKDLDQASDQLAQGLLAAGIKPAARVGLLAKDCIGGLKCCLVALRWGRYLPR